MSQSFCDFHALFTVLSEPVFPRGWEAQEFPPSPPPLLWKALSHSICSLFSVPQTLVLSFLRIICYTWLSSVSLPPFPFSTLSSDGTFWTIPSPSPLRCIPDPTALHLTPIGILSHIRAEATLPLVHGCTHMLKEVSSGAMPSSSVQQGENTTFTWALKQIGSQRSLKAQHCFKGTSLKTTLEDGWTCQAYTG